MAAVVIPFPRRGDDAAAADPKVVSAFVDYAVRRWARRNRIAPAVTDRLVRAWARAAARPDSERAYRAAVELTRSLRTLYPRLAHKGAGA